jgi:hypothetical protein
MSLINRRKVKELALELSRQTRAGKFTRVRSGFLNRIESRLRAIVAQEVRSTPSKGKTL